MYVYYQRERDTDQKIETARRHVHTPEQQNGQEYDDCDHYETVRHDVFTKYSTYRKWATTGGGDV